MQTKTESQAVETKKLPLRASQKENGTNLQIEEYSKIFQSVKSKLPLGAANVINAHYHAQLGVYIIRLIERHLTPSIISLINPKEERTLYKALDNIVLAILAETFGCANCDGFAALSLFELFKAGNWNNIYYITAHEKSNERNNHSLLVLNVEKQSSYDNPISWKNSIVLDPYYNKLIVLDSNNIFKTLEKYTGLKEPVVCLTVLFDSPFSKLDWLLLYRALLNLKDIIKKMDFADLVDKDFRKQKSQNTSAMLPISYELHKLKILNRLQTEIESIGKRVFKKPQTLALSGNCNANCAVNAAVYTLAAGLGAGFGAALQNTSINPSASIVGLGTGIASTAYSFFSSPTADPQPTFAKATYKIAFMNLLGASIAYVGAKFFIDASTSTQPFIDAAIGFPITVGLLYCASLLLQDYNDSIFPRKEGARII